MTKPLQPFVPDTWFAAVPLKDGAWFAAAVPPKDVSKVLAAVPLKDGGTWLVTKADLPPPVLPYPKEVPRPPWDDSERLQTWTLAQLDVMDKAVAREEDLKNLPMIGVPNRPWVTPKPNLADMQPKERAIAEADYYGNIEPLRKLYPELARFLFPPKLKPGQHFESPGDEDPWDARARLRGARYDAHRIRAIWKAAYDGKCNRSESQITAVDIAAKRWGVPVDAIRKGFPSEVARQRKNETRRRSRKKP